MDKLEILRGIVDEALESSEYPALRRDEYIHLYGVSQCCALLAGKRGLDRELARIAGMLHDIAVCRTGKPEDHAARGAEEARDILPILGLSEGEIAMVCQAIARHSDKKTVHDPFDEMLKDADILQRYLYSERDGVAVRRRKRVKRLLAELDLPY
ncbi:MAG: HD domain-containing protein [bacterium]|nr:HD domain-containing protein [bacterium]